MASNSSPKTVFVVGSGPMIGSHVARFFATHAFTNIALFARTPDHLDRDARFVTTAAPSASVRTYPADVTDQAALTDALDRAVSEAGVPEVVVYNAARIRYGTFDQYAPDDLVADYKVPNLGLFITATVLLPHLQAMATNNPTAHPSLFITSGAIIHQPFGPVFSLSMAKAAQASLAKLLAEQNRGLVHVAVVTVGGPVSPEEDVNNPQNIASKFWDLYQQEKGNWAFEIKCGW